MAQFPIGIAGGAIWHTRTGQRINVAIDILYALHYLHPTHFVQQQGRSINVGAEYVGVNGIFSVPRQSLSDAGGRSTLSEVAEGLPEFL
jgi:hypothetical protein